MVPSKLRTSPSLRKPGAHAGSLRWDIPQELLESPAVAYRNNFAAALARLPADEIVTSYVYLTCAQMERMLSLACSLFGLELYGTGLEVGSGCGLLACTAAKSHRVERVYALEICEKMVELVMPKVATRVLGARASKLIPVMGSFDDIRLPSASVDFIVEIDSLHHSDNLSVTLRECARVLRAGGHILCFDRCHSNDVTDRDVELMLAQVYSEDFLRKNHYPPGITMTRRDNGEHEYRLHEWQAAFRSAGLKLVAARKFVRQIRPALAAKGCLSLLPRALTKHVYRTANADLRTTIEWLRQPLLVRNRDPFFGNPVLAPKETTVFLLTR
jgi:ubiquinone/menaquinone biosynthesis C-methylase UbiE